MNHIQRQEKNNDETFLFTSESVGEGHPGKNVKIFKLKKKAYLGVKNIIFYLIWLSIRNQFIFKGLKPIGTALNYQNYKNSN